ncbi:GAF domain-containing protein [Rufibacter immobilis]|uniref:GAF domain-containing protein n=1 Tax=Rufibacter immobilis TaxID=1348778 RepID=UPI0035EAC8ED
MNRSVDKDLSFSVLEDAQEQVKALQLELAQVREELAQAKAQAASGDAFPASLSSAKPKGPFGVELELLGKQVLEKNATPGSTLEEIVSLYLAGIEKLHPKMRCVCMRLQERHLYVVAAPNFPENFIEAIDGIEIGQTVGTCGAAADQQEKVICTDIARDPRWQDLRVKALANGFRASWAFPLIGSGGKMLGTLGIYYDEPKAPAPEEEASLESVSALLQLVLENKLAEIELRQSNERYYYATIATNDAIWDFDIEAKKIKWGIGYERLFGYKVQEYGANLICGRRRYTQMIWAGCQVP